MDRYGRKVTTLRVSITKACNLNCIYCHREGSSGGGPEITLPQFEVAVEAARSLGIDRIKLTGGEPLIRNDVIDFVRTATSVDGIAEVSMTTNGVLLTKLASSLADAGLKRVNVNLPSLRPERYHFITGYDLLDKVKDGVKEAADVGLDPVKLNMVVLKGVNEDEVQDLIDFASKVPAIVQLIELERLGKASSKIYDELHVDLSNLEKWLEEQASKVVFRGLQNRRKYVLPNGQEVEVVRPYHRKFCMGCTRLRLTADGKIKPCLMREDNTVSVLDELAEGVFDKVVQKFREALELREPYFA